MIIVKSHFCFYYQLMINNTHIPRWQGSWDQHGAHLGPTGPRWAPCWPHEHAIWLLLLVCSKSTWHTSSPTATYCIGEMVLLFEIWLKYIDISNYVNHTTLSSAIGIFTTAVSNACCATLPINPPCFTYLVMKPEYSVRSHSMTADVLAQGDI